MADALETKIEAARKRLEQKMKGIEKEKTRLQGLEARAGQKARKLDARRKIILGGLLIDAAEKDDRFARVVTALMERISRDQDRKTFEGWKPPSLAASSSPTPEPLGVNQPLSEPPQAAE